MEEMKKIVVIGDIVVKADSGFISLSVDDEGVLFMDREAQFGLQELIDTLQSLTI